MATSRDVGQFHIPSADDLQARRVQRYGDSLGVHIPIDDRREHGIEKGDEVGVRVGEDGAVVIEPDIDPGDGRKVQRYGDSLGVHIPIEDCRDAGISKGDSIGVRVAAVQAESGR